MIRSQSSLTDSEKEARRLSGERWNVSTPPSCLRRLELDISQDVTTAISSPDVRQPMQITEAVLSKSSPLGINESEEPAVSDVPETISSGSQISPRPRRPRSCTTDLWSRFQPVNPKEYSQQSSSSNPSSSSGSWMTDPSFRENYLDASSAMIITPMLTEVLLETHNGTDRYGYSFDGDLNEEGTEDDEEDNKEKSDSGNDEMEKQRDQMTDGCEKKTNLDSEEPSSVHNLETRYAMRERQKDNYFGMIHEDRMELDKMLDDLLEERAPDSGVGFSSEARELLHQESFSFVSETVRKAW
ncbi:hypothetical protein CAEBREN_23809 [Caenorhabditis brenneri]|uniref:Uncharacterized protein n=1 Tax=Caenorhabditis brenneri TaxID=135651 RepID=G0MFW0_CAEBE|nr:hypothetical protein CAEBREN_23809 [Caenorhabditis brenneri]